MSTPLFGIFDESDGCLDSGYTSYEAAASMLASEPGYFGSNAYAAQVCDIHEQQPREGCDICESEED